MQANPGLKVAVPHLALVYCKAGSNGFTCESQSPSAQSAQWTSEIDAQGSWQGPPDRLTDDSLPLQASLGHLLHGIDAHDMDDVQGSVDKPGKISGAIPITCQIYNQEMSIKPAWSPHCVNRILSFNP